ncbi:hypothetical protein FACS1894158_10350 [Betaproteobacteria bacterium]|nr:hypothetical protein FACS1894158_10350 [Betaproteobacteria bacterium]
MLGQQDNARAELRKALDKALPDGLFMPFVENIALIGELQPLVKGNIRASALKNILALAEKQQAGQEAVSRELSIPFGMSGREYDAAKLATQGFSNIEISETMAVSINTVKTFMKSVYRKTGVFPCRALKKLFRPM